MHMKRVSISLVIRKREFKTTIKYHIRMTIFFFFFFLHCKACVILVPSPGIELGTTTVKALSPNHWTTREF